jgi:tetratricopeptide (TPR) repeat protein
LIYLFFGVGFLYAGGFRRPKAAFYIQKGDKFLSSQNYDAAFWEYQKALFFTPRNPTIYFNLGKVYEAKNQIDKAIENYLKAKKYNSTDSKILFALGKIYFEKKEWEKAKEEFLSPSLYSSPYEEEGRIRVARIYLIEGNLVEAEANLGLVLSKDTKNIQAQYYDLIILLIKHPELVVERSSFVCHPDPDLASGEGSRRDSSASPQNDNECMGRLKVLKKAAKRLVKIKNSLTKKVILGATFNQVDELDLANRLLNEVIKEEKNYRDAWLYLGENYYLQKDYIEANKCLDKALKLDPTNNRAKELKKKLMEIY